MEYILWNHTPPNQCCLHTICLKHHAFFLVYLMPAFSKWQVAEMTKTHTYSLKYQPLDVSVLEIRRGCVPEQLPCSKPLGKAWSSLDSEPVLMPLLLKFYHTNVLGNTKGNSWPDGKLSFTKHHRFSFFFSL